MDILNGYLKELLSSCSDELRLEPDRNPYLVAADTTRDVANVPLKGTQISTLVFPLIPTEVRSELPHSPEVEFVHPHNLGKFNFHVQKSPSGFIVTIRPVLTDSGSSMNLPVAPPEPPAATPRTADYSGIAEDGFAEPAAEYSPISVESAPEFEQVGYGIESSSFSFNATSAEPVATATIEDLLVEEKSAAAEYVPDDSPEIEVISVNDPQFQTVFSETAPDTPIGRRDDLLSSEYTAPAAMHTNEEPPPAQPASFDPAPIPSAESQFVPAMADSVMNARMDAYFHLMAELGASDLHLSVSVPPMVRKDGKIATLQDGEPALTAEVMRNLLTSIMPGKNQEEFANRNDTDFAYEIPGLARFRCNVFADRKGMGGVFRIIPSKILTAEQLGLSKAIMDLTALSKGLVVVTGPTGSGKSTTLCAMVDSINKTREDHIITIEDPIEFTHENQKCLVNQREVHNHTDSFKDALRAALREDPDILLVGEMRDLETISIAIETAETGHLVFGTLHTTTAPSTVDRIIDQFPADRQQQIRVMLSESLKGVIAQTLLPKKGGGRVAALEILIITPAISNLIREGKTFQIPSAMQTGKNHGMVMLNEALFEHVKNGTVEPRDAYIKSVDKTGFETMLTRGGFKL
ncbi:MAG: type IV pilus twitching motility protein PilT [Pyrinomonadaceae bacterium]